MLARLLLQERSTLAIYIRPARFSVFAIFRFRSHFLLSKGKKILFWPAFGVWQESLFNIRKLMLRIRCQFLGKTGGGERVLSLPALPNLDTQLPDVPREYPHGYRSEGEMIAGWLADKSPKTRECYALDVN
mgnify:FL=1